LSSVPPGVSGLGAVPAILLVGFVVMQALGSTRKQSKKRAFTPEPRAVEIQKLVFGDLTLAVEGDGVIESERELEIISEANGRVTLARNNLKDGTFVPAGEVVVKVDSRDVENDLFALRSEFLNAVAALLPELQIDDPRVYKKWFDYFNSLDINQPVRELPEITRAQEKIKVSAKDIFGKYYAVKNQELLLSKHTIRAPFSGYITSTGVIENTFVSVGQHLFTLSDAVNLVVPVPLIVEESQQLDFSTSPRVTIYEDERGGESITGRIRRRDTNLDRNSQTLSVYVKFTNAKLHPHFLPGNYVHVNIEGRTLKDVAAIRRHLVDNEGYVFTMEVGKLGRQRVEVVALQGDLAIVRNTVPDETVIVTTLLQKPLIGMAIRDANATTEEPVQLDLAGEENGAETATASRSAER
ncbi:MAG: efflux RND transporter periplasmic adaptor subunit, partial [Acidimicrobiia bacterium]